MINFGIFNVRKIRLTIARSWSCSDPIGGVERSRKIDSQLEQHWRFHARVGLLTSSSLLLVSFARISHRDVRFERIVEEAVSDLRTLLYVFTVPCRSVSR